MNYRSNGFLLPLLLLAGCEQTAEVSGMLGTSELLTGSISQYDDGGTIEIFGAPGTRCTGNFDYVRSRQGIDGSGMLVCDDRRTGPFRFVVSGMKHGAGSGSLAGVPLRFRF